MLTIIKKFLKDLLTENDNETYCLARVLSILVVLCFIVGAALMFWYTKKFDFSGYGSCAMQLLGGSGALIGLKQVSSKQ